MQIWTKVDRTVVIYKLWILGAHQNFNIVAISNNSERLKFQKSSQKPHKWYQDFYKTCNFGTDLKSKVTATMETDSQKTFHTFNPIHP